LETIYRAVLQGDKLPTAEQSNVEQPNEVSFHEQ